MIRDLYNVRVQPEPGATTTPLTDEEEQRVQATLFSELGNEIADRGWARFPAYTPEERRRLVAVAHRLTAHWGRQVFVEAEDLTRVRLSLTDQRHAQRPITADQGDTPRLGPRAGRTPGGRAASGRPTLGRHPRVGVG